MHVFASLNACLPLGAAATNAKVYTSTGSGTWTEVDVSPSLKNGTATDTCYTVNGLAANDVWVASPAS